MKEKNNFVLYNDDFYMIEELKDEQVGNVMKSIFKYSINGESPEYKKGSAESILFLHFKRSIDINNEKYYKTCEENRKKALKRWKKIIYDNQEFTREMFMKYCNENKLNEDFESILLEQKELFDNGEYDIIKEKYNNNLVSEETINNIFQ